MKDFVSGRDIDIQGLLAVVQAAEQQPDNLFCMSHYFSERYCGTSACLIGSFCLHNPGDKLQYMISNGILLNGVSMKGISAIIERFGLSEKECSFLFIDHYIESRAATSLSKKGALSRLRKFIYYKMHKSDMTSDYARRLEGNQWFVKKAIEDEKCYDRSI